MAEQFGKTWWGSEWLRSLTHIDLRTQRKRYRHKTEGQYHHCKSVRKQDNTI